MEATVIMGDAAERTFTVTNTGTAPAEIELTERRGPFEPLAPQLASPDSVQFSEPVSPGPSSILSQEGQQAATSVQPTIGLDWDSGPDAPAGIARYAFAQCPDEPDVFYVISGTSNGATVSTTWRFDAEEEEWTTLAPIPTGSEASSAACYQGRIYVMGGSGSNQHFVYDIGHDSWSAAAPVPRGVAGAAAGVANGKVYLIGGDDDFFPLNGVSDEVNVYNIATNSWSSGTSMPHGSSNPGYVQMDEFIYIVGGWFTSSPGSNFNVSQRYDMGNDTWEIGPEFTIAKADFALAGTSAALYAIGGDSDGGRYFDPSSSVHRLDLADWPGGTWEDLDDPLPGPRTANQAGFCTNTVANGEIWSVGGLDDSFTWYSDAFYRETREVCGVVDLPWLEVSPTTATVQPGDSLVVTVSMNSDAKGIEQPGAHHASLTIRHNTPYRLDPVGVTMNVEPPRSWGKIAGTVMGIGCDGFTTPLSGATVRIEGRTAVTLLTGGGGTYEWWMSAQGRQHMIVAKDGYGAQIRSTNLRQGQTTVENYELMALC